MYVRHLDKQSHCPQAIPLPLIHCLYPSGLHKCLYKDSNGDDSWALITGASDGIGRALAWELSARSFNVILHGRNEAKLSQVLEELSAAHSERKFRTTVADASAFTKADIDRILETVGDLHPTILINNVGGTAPLTPHHKLFHNTTPIEIEALYASNVHFPLQLSQALLPRLKALGKPLLVLRCGSISSVGWQYLAAYSGCKAALLAWNRALVAE